MMQRIRAPRCSNSPARDQKGEHYSAIGPVVFDHTSLSIDVDRDLRLVYYAAREGQAQSRSFEQWLQAEREQAARDVDVLN